MSVPCDAGGLEVSVVWPLDLVESGVELVELPMVPLDESTGPIAPLELVVPVDESAPVEGAAGRA